MVEQSFEALVSLKKMTFNVCCLCVELFGPRRFALHGSSFSPAFFMSAFWSRFVVRFLYLVNDVSRFARIDHGYSMREQGIDAAGAKRGRT